MAAPPSSHTLNIVVNALFAMSMICSLVTAFFAVVGKQWLSHYAKQSRGSVDYMRKELQRKIIGAKHFHLHSVSDAVLMTTIQVALLLFIVGFILFLVTINMVITYTVIPLAGIGMAGYLVTVGLALWDPSCPYQTPVTTIIIPTLSRLLYRIVDMASNVYNLTYVLGVSVTSDALGTHNDESASRRRNVKQAFKTLIVRFTPPDHRHRQTPEWDVYYRQREKMANLFRRKTAEAHFNIEAACWVIETAKDEIDARRAAATFLLLKDRNHVSFVGMARKTIRRIRDLIRLSDEDLHQEELRWTRSRRDPEELKEHEWKKLCLYVHVLSHNFAGHRTANSAWYDAMDKIYLYQTLRARKDMKEHAHTVVPARMVGVIKILLRHKAGVYFPSRELERERTLRDRLYNCVTEKGCMPKALSLTAFAMKTLPNVEAIADNDAKSLDGETEDVHEELWKSYISEDLGDICRNIIGAINTYTKYHNAKTPPHSLPSLSQLVNFLKRVEDHIQVYKPAKQQTEHRKFFVEACVALLRSLKRAGYDNEGDRKALYDQTHSILRLAIDQVTSGAVGGNLTDLATVSAWCPLLVQLSLDIQGNGEIMKRALDILTRSHEALRKTNRANESGRTFAPLVVAVGLAIDGDPPIYETAIALRKEFIEEGLRLVEFMTETLAPKQLIVDPPSNYMFASKEGTAAMTRYLTVMISRHEILHGQQSEFLHQYAMLIRCGGWNPRKQEGVCGNFLAAVTRVITLEHYDAMNGEGAWDDSGDADSPISPASLASSRKPWAQRAPTIDPFV